jgi:hypothetical protein
MAIPSIWIFFIIDLTFVCGFSVGWSWWFCVLGSWLR